MSAKSKPKPMKGLHVTAEWAGVKYAGVILYFSCDGNLARIRLTEDATLLEPDPNCPQLFQAGMEDFVPVYVLKTSA